MERERGEEETERERERISCYFAVDVLEVQMKCNGNLLRKY